MNRGGSLFVDHMQYEHYPELAEAGAWLAAAVGRPVCGAPFGYLFVGYDGQYYLCCSDWEKQAPLGSVFDKSFVDVAQAKLDLVVVARPGVPHLQPRPDQPSHRGAAGRGAAATCRQGRPTSCWPRSPPTTAPIVERVLGQLGLDVPVAPPTRRLIPVRAL